MAKSILDEMLSGLDEVRHTELAARRIVSPYIAEANAEYKEWRYSPNGNALVVDQLSKTDYCCPVCSENLKARSATIDHLEPKSKHFHKSTDKSNFLVMCWSCNNRKSDREFPQWRKTLPQYHRQSLDYAILLIHGRAKLDELVHGAA